MAMSTAPSRQPKPPALAVARFLQRRSSASPRASACPASAWPPTSRRSMAATACRTACGTDPLIFVSIAQRRHGEHRRATAPRWARACAPSMPMVVADELEADWSACASCRRRATRRGTATRTPTARAACGITSMPMRRCGAAARADAGAGRGQPVEGAGRRGQGAEPRGRAQAERPASSASARSRRGAAKLPVPARETLVLKDPSKFRYIGKDDMPWSTVRHHHRQGAVRHRRAPRRHGLCRRRPAAGVRRQGQELRRGRGA